MRSKKFNENVFDTIGPKEAYFLGLLFADGCVCETTNGRYTTNLKLKDEELVKEFKKFMGSSNKITKTRSKEKDTVYFSISLCSKYLYSTLRALGCVKQKSHTLKEPNIKEGLIPFFLLGVFDGDGSLSLNESVNSWRACIGSGSFYFFNWLEKQIGTVLGYKYSKEERLHSRNSSDPYIFYVLTLSGLTGKLFLEYLYSKADQNNIPYLARKHNVFKVLEKFNFRKGPNYFAWEIDILRDSRSLKECSDRIRLDSRNYGWERSVESLSQLKCRLKKKGLL